MSTREVCISFISFVITIICMLPLFFTMINDMDDLDKKIIVLENDCGLFELQLENQLLKEEVEAWRDHATRMKRIAGVPDTTKWSFKQKVIHPISTVSLVKK